LTYDVNVSGWPGTSDVCKTTSPLRSRVEHPIMFEAFVRQQRREPSALYSV